MKVIEIYLVWYNDVAWLPLYKCQSKGKSVLWFIGHEYATTPPNGYRTKIELIQNLHALELIDISKKKRDAEQ